MPNGWLSTPNSVPGAKKQLKEAQDVTSWPVYVVKTSVICVPAPGNLIIRTISNATFLRKAQPNMSPDKKRFLRR